ncbi:MAG: isoprenylcysteine carboxylmethyltransferase family protein [Candidimonas sp.]|nr:MAG: isoprenylcysteine carboxylmethyltransferase family protein [Candidimonas sp.]TAM20888.1 MAG: isoprenylcysteine carboxylmethyltransferase family protein [Candidimonas sp.]TAM75872.1 MAG: isoprenylcysteine carboxylmethyltransferase family protein [Candidimonas sp.]
MNSLELMVPPPIVMLVTALVMWLLSVFLPGFTLHALHSVTAAAIIGLAGLSLGMAGIIAFKRAQTTVDPRRPGSASTLVTSGIYRLTRNPMYLGILLVLIAWAIFLGNGLSLLFAFAFAMYIHRYQIRPEERFLQQKFGTDFASYKAKVRMWI